MSKTLLAQITAYIDPAESKRLDKLREEIPRARILSRAIHRYLADLESGKVKLLPSGEVEEQKKGVSGPGHQSKPTNSTTNTYELNPVSATGGSKLS